VAVLCRYEYQLQQVVGYRGLHARMQARQKRVQEMHGALTGVEQRISRMGDHHARHTQEAREHRHRQQEISHQMLRVMGKVERLHSERLRLPWTAAEDDLAARLRLLTKQLQHPAHPVNALNHLGPV
jgi:chromosome segregation ATPase